MYAPAFVTKDSLSVAAISEMVGMDLKKISLEKDTVQAIVTAKVAQFLALKHPLSMRRPD